MRQVFTSQDVTQVGYYKSILDDAKIASFIRNENGSNPATSGAMFLPALCVVKDSEYADAIRILKARQAEEGEIGKRPEWRCAACTERNPANFELCWNCGAARSDV